MGNVFVGTGIPVSFFCLICSGIFNRTPVTEGGQSMMQEAINRIRRMEACFDRLQSIADEDAVSREMLQTLTQYYESGQWLQDYELDEKGLLPQDMKRGILAQDAVYDFLDRINRDNKNSSAV